MATSPWYREGTAKFTQGSTTVTGTGTRWVDFVRAGDGIQGPDGKMYQVMNVASNTSLSISPAYGSETTYWTIPIQGYVKRLADAASQLVRDFEGGAVEAIDAADRAKQSAIEASVSEGAALSQANRSQAEADRSEAEADRAQQAADDAVAVVTGGDASIEPEAGKIPLAGASGTIKQAWVNNLEFELDALRVAKNKMLYGDGPYPVLDLQFQGAKYLDPRIQFTRASLDWDESGREYGIDEPALTDKGLWVSGARTNLFRNSMGQQEVAVTSQVYTLSFYGEGSVQLNGAHTHDVTGTDGGRTTYTFTPVSGQLVVTISDVDRVQLELGEAATPYIPTENSQVTVAATTVSLPVSNLALSNFSIISSYAEVHTNSSYAFQYLWGMSSLSSTLNYVGARFRSSNRGLALSTSSGTMGERAIESSVMFGAAISKNNISQVVNGGAITSLEIVNPLDFSAMPYLFIGGLTTSESFKAKGFCKSIAIYKTILSENELRGLTS